MKCAYAPSNVNCCQGCPDDQKENCDIYKELTNPRNFAVINTRVHTRETSTLMFTTVAVSASLLLLGILMGMENPIIPILFILQIIPLNLGLINYMIYALYIFQNSNDLLFWTGVLIILIGITYRGFTGITIDEKDYDDLEELGFNRNNYHHGGQIIVRGFIVRFFFGIPLVAWLLYKGFQTIDPQGLCCWACLACGFMALYLFLPLKEKKILSLLDAAYRYLYTTR